MSRPACICEEFFTLLEATIENQFFDTDARSAGNRKQIALGHFQMLGNNSWAEIVIV